jgi:hypothetical protein
MGLKVSATEAAQLTGQSARTIRRWIASHRLSASPAGMRAPGQRTGPNRWQIDVDELARMPGVELDPTILTQLEARARRAAQRGTTVVDQLAALEREVADLRDEVVGLSTRIAALEEQPSAERGMRPASGATDGTPLREKD